MRERLGQGGGIRALWVRCDFDIFTLFSGGYFRWYTGIAEWSALEQRPSFHCHGRLAHTLHPHLDAMFFALDVLSSEELTACDHELNTRAHELNTRAHEFLR